MICKFYL